MSAGLAAGDVVETIDGRPAAEIHHLAWLEMLESKNVLRLRVKGASGPRDVVVEVATLVE